MQTSETEVELFSNSGVSPADDRHVSVLLDAGANGSGVRRNGSVTPKRKRRLRDGASRCERRTVHVSVHFFYVVALGALFCMVVYLIVLNRGIYAYLRDSARVRGEEPNWKAIATAASLNSATTERRWTSVNRDTSSSSTSTTSTSTSTTSTTTTTAPTTTTTTTTTTATTTTTSDLCPEVHNRNDSRLVTVDRLQTGLRLYVTSASNHSEAVAFCRSLRSSSSATPLGLIQFSERNKFENTRDDLELLIDDWALPIWVNAVVFDGVWYWLNGTERTLLSNEEIDFDENVNSTDCVVLQKRESELRLEFAQCYDDALVVCECAASF